MSMMDLVLPFVPPVVLFLSICSFEISYSSLLARLATYAVITASATSAIFNPPFDNALFNYLNGFFSFWNIIWSANILFVHHPKELKRLRKRSRQAKDAYCWEGLPPFGYYRAKWALDLTTNYRGIGWEYAMPKAGYPPLDPARGGAGDVVQRLPHVWKQIQRILTAYIALDVSNYLLFGAWAVRLHEVHIIAEIFGTALALFGFIDGLHALTTVVGVGLASGDPWMYPPLFGKLASLKRMRIKDVWGRLWHDLFKNGFLFLGQWLLPRGPAVLLFCFFLSSLLHAAASYSASLDARSTLWVFVFFCAQPIAVVFQGLAISSIAKMFGGAKSNLLVKGLLQIVDFSIGAFLVYNTFPWACQDVAMREAIRVVSPPWSVINFVLGKI